MKVLALGTCCVDVYPQKDIIIPGGEALNIAAQLSNLSDVDVHLMGVIGNDNYAEVIKNSIKDLSINMNHLYEVDGETANHVIKITNDGDRYFEKGSWSGGVSASLNLDYIDVSILDDVDIIFTTLWEPNLRKLIELRKRKTFLLAVDFNVQREFADWEDIINQIDVCFISGDENLNKLFLTRSFSTDTVFVMTLGEKGSYGYYHGTRYDCDAVIVDEVIDTTGCGDCYLAYFGVEYLKSGNLVQSMNIASNAAAKVTSYVGGFKYN